MAQNRLSRTSTTSFQTAIEEPRSSDMSTAHKDPLSDSLKDILVRVQSSTLLKKNELSPEFIAFYKNAREILKEQWPNYKRDIANLNNHALDFLKGLTSITNAIDFSPINEYDFSAEELSEFHMLLFSDIESLPSNLLTIIDNVSTCIGEIVCHSGNLLYSLISFTQSLHIAKVEGVITFNRPDIPLPTNQYEIGKYAFDSCQTQFNDFFGNLFEAFERAGLHSNFFTTEDLANFTNLLRSNQNNTVSDYEDQIKISILNKALKNNPHRMKNCFAQNFDLETHSLSQLAQFVKFIHDGHISSDLDNQAIEFITNAFNTLGSDNPTTQELLQNLSAPLTNTRQIEYRLLAELISQANDESKNLFDRLTLFSAIGSSRWHSTDSKVNAFQQEVDHEVELAISRANDITALRKTVYCDLDKTINTHNRKWYSIFYTPSHIKEAISIRRQLYINNITTSDPEALAIIKQHATNIQTDTDRTIQQSVMKHCFSEAQIKQLESTSKTIAQDEKSSFFEKIKMKFKRLINRDPIPTLPERNPIKPITGAPTRVAISAPPTLPPRQRPKTRELPTPTKEL